jgi:hypothetical protein
MPNRHGFFEFLASRGQPFVRVLLQQPVHFIRKDVQVVLARDLKDYGIVILRRHEPVGLCGKFEHDLGACYPDIVLQKFR